jgi:hypothetical protein
LFGCGDEDEACGGCLGDELGGGSAGSELGRDPRRNVLAIMSAARFAVTANQLVP